MSEVELLNRLEILSTTNKYLSYEPSNYPKLHEYLGLQINSPNLNTISNVTIKIKLLIMKFYLELIMNKISLSRRTLTLINDLINNNETSNLVEIVKLRSILLKIESDNNDASSSTDNDDNNKNNNNNNNNNNKNKNKQNTNVNNNNQNKKDVAINEIVKKYIDESSDVIIKTFNKSISLSLTSSGVESMRDKSDLYELLKFKSNINSTTKIDDLINLTNIRPNDYEVWSELSEEYIKLGKIKEAIWCLNEICAGLPFAYNIWCKRGELCNLMGAIEGKNWYKIAISLFSYSLEICENYSRGWCGLYVSLKKLNSKELTYIKMLNIVDNKLNGFLIDDNVNSSEIGRIKWILENY